MPAFIGQLAIQLDRGTLFFATALTAGSWTLITGTTPLFADVLTLSNDAGAQSIINLVTIDTTGGVLISGAPGLTGVIDTGVTPTITVSGGIVESAA